MKSSRILHRKSQNLAESAKVARVRNCMVCVAILRPSNLKFIFGKLPMIVVTGLIRSDVRTEPADGIENEENQQKQANPDASNNGAAKVKTAAAEHKKNNDDQ
jgi:hypothetical protein